MSAPSACRAWVWRLRPCRRSVQHRLDTADHRPSRLVLFLPLYRRPDRDRRDQRRRRHPRSADRPHRGRRRSLARQGAGDRQEAARLGHQLHRRTDRQLTVAVVGRDHDARQDHPGDLRQRRRVGRRHEVSVSLPVHLQHQPAGRDRGPLPGREPEAEEDRHPAGEHRVRRAGDRGLARHLEEARAGAGQGRGLSAHGARPQYLRRQPAQGRPRRADLLDRQRAGRGDGVQRHEQPEMVSADHRPQRPVPRRAVRSRAGRGDRPRLRHDVPLADVDRHDEPR